MVNWLSSCDAEVIKRLDELHSYVASRSPSTFTAYQTHMELNRYDDFMCYDRNQVHLGEGGHEYIHANEIQLFNMTYILTQAPLPHTIPDFYRMVTQVRNLGFGNHKILILFIFRKERT